MINNDEQVFYTDVPISRIVEPGPDSILADDMHLVFSRPVYQEELDEGLVERVGRTWMATADIDPPIITISLDGIYKFREHFVTWRKLTGQDDFKTSLTKVITHFIASNFYDCMSGGCPRSALALCREIIQRFQLPKDAEVYPDAIPHEEGEEATWYTIKDFMRETEDTFVLQFELLKLVEELMPELIPPANPRGPRHYRKKPVVIEALQLRWDNWDEMCKFAGVGKLEEGKPCGRYLGPDGQPLPWDHISEVMCLVIPTLEGDMVARQGDYVIRGVKGELYPCKPDIFEETYELVE